MVRSPDWDGSKRGYDLALIRLESPVTSITPATLYLPGDGSELGQLAYMVGYGATGTGLSGYDPWSSGTKRAATNVIDLIDEYSGFQHVMVVDFDNPDNPDDNYTGSPIPTELEGLLAPGDSGGGTFIQVNGEWKLAGIHSFTVEVWDGDRNSRDYGDLGGFVRVSRHIDWISQYVPLIPEPGTLTLLALGSAMLLRRGRGQPTSRG